MRQEWRQCGEQWESGSVWLYRSRREKNRYTGKVTLWTQGSGRMPEVIELSLIARNPPFETMDSHLHSAHLPTLEKARNTYIHLCFWGLMHNQKRWRPFWLVGKIYRGKLYIGSCEKRQYQDCVKPTQSIFPCCGIGQPTCGISKHVLPYFYHPFEAPLLHDCVPPEG